MKIVDAKDTRRGEIYFLEAKRKEVNGLKDTHTWQFIHESEVWPDANILGGRYMLTLKAFGSPAEKAKVRNVP